MENAIDRNKQLVFGLDIGTRNVVGTVGYKDGKDFYAVAQCVKEHETRAMMDGQIHDIGRVGSTIAEVRRELEDQLGEPLSEVCIAAAGRVLKTVTTTVEYEFPEETVVDLEALHTLDLLGVESAQEILREKNDTKYKFYCVGYSVVRYYLNDELFTSLEGHKANKIAEEIIVTFLPEDVVDGLYSAVGIAGLEVANMTLEPIAAINVAIPEAFRMLNIALVDVGAGTSDICITKDGSIIAYGMIPCAGDEMTELIVQQYLVDFNMAEHIKLSSGTGEEIEFQDIMGITHKIASEEIWDLTEESVKKITTDIAEKIKELNGGKSVSAAFIVGGGGKIHGFTESLADNLGIQRERVALRGEEVMQSVHFIQEEVRKDPLLVTPIGICLNYYEQKNNFIMVHFNGERMKLYDNSHLTVVDAALQAGFPNEKLFPRRGKAVQFTINGRQRVVRGEAGESAIIKMNGNPVGINTPLEPNCDITIEPSTEGSEAEFTIEQLDEYSAAPISFFVNGKEINCEKFVEVNGKLEPGSYRIRENDVIETRNYYTLGQLAEVMDVEIDMEKDILVNNRPADFQTLVYENFEVEWSVLGYASAPVPKEQPKQLEEAAGSFNESEEAAAPDKEEEGNALTDSVKVPEQAEKEKTGNGLAIVIIVNGRPVQLDKKESYVFVDIFDYIDFDLSQSNGRGIVTKINGVDAQFTQNLQDGDKIDIYWKEN